MPLRRRGWNHQTMKSKVASSIPVLLIGSLTVIRACGFSTLNRSFNPSTSSTYAVSLRTRELIVLAISCLFFSSYLPAVIYKWSIFSIPFGVSRQPYIINKVCHAVRIKMTQMYHITSIGWLHMPQCETAFNFDKYICCENSWTYFLLHFTSDLLSSAISVSYTHLTLPTICSV